MNEQTAQGNWQQLSGRIKQKWGKLTDDDLMKARGDREYLVGKLHEEYGIARDRAEDELETLGYGEYEQDSTRQTRGTSQGVNTAGYANTDNIAGSGLNDQGESSGLEQSREGGNREHLSGSMGSGAGSGQQAAGRNRSSSRSSQSITGDNGLSGGEGSLSEDDYSDENIADMNGGEGAGHTLEAGSGEAADTGNIGSSSGPGSGDRSRGTSGGAAEQASGRGRSGGQQRGGQHSHGGRGGNR